MCAEVLTHPEQPLAAEASLETEATPLFHLEAYQEAPPAASWAGRRGVGAKPAQDRTMHAQATCQQSTAHAWRPCMAPMHVLWGMLGGPAPEKIQNGQHWSSASATRECPSCLPQPGAGWMQRQTAAGALHAAQTAVLTACTLNTNEKGLGQMPQCKICTNFSL